MNNLKMLRNLNKLTQTEIAKILGIEQSTYGKYERNEIPLNEIYAKKLADYYNVSVSFILNDKNTEIIITKEQYKDLLKARDTINSIEKVYSNKVNIENNYGTINFNQEDKK